MIIGKRIYWVAALVAVLALAGAAITVTSRITSADPTPAIQTCDQEADTDDVEDECGDQNEVEDANEAEDGDAQAASGTLDDGKDLLSEAVITIDAAIDAAQSVASGPVGEVDLEHVDGRLVFNVDIGDKDVKVDASDGSIVSADADD